MRYTKELQDNVKTDINRGLSAEECSKKYDIPVSVILRWNNINTTDQRAKEIALRKYQENISSTEINLTNRISKSLKDDVSDDEYLELCDKISGELYSMAAEIIKQERDLNQKRNIYDGEILLEITDRWNNNDSIKKFSIEN